MPNKICPECGEDLTEVDIIAHRNFHYPKGRPYSEFYPLSAERWDELTKMVEKEA